MVHNDGYIQIYTQRLFHSHDSVGVKWPKMSSLYVNTADLVG